MIARLTLRLSVGTLKLVLLGLATALVLAIAGGIAYLEHTANLKPWHAPVLDAEFTADSPVRTFADYLALEDRLFSEVGHRVIDKLPPEDRGPINRFTRGSLSDPGNWPQDWNRSYVLPAENPRAVFLLVHGMSDSPYSLNGLAATLHAAGAAIVGLRLPGHGTIPAGLLDSTWQDMAAAVALGVTEAQRIAGPGVPVYMVGYSIGGALSVDYALDALQGIRKPVDGIVLISPAIGLTRLAGLASVQAGMGHLLGLRALAWSSTTLEFDPFKYGSFAINAAEQSWRVTREITGEIARLAAAGQLGGMPPVLAFQSIIDATVSTRAVIDSLFMKLPPGPHELVVFDMNRRSAAIDLLAADPGPEVERMLTGGGLAFTLSLVTNTAPDRRDAMVLTRAPSDLAPRAAPLGLEWPEDVYSLSHIALPFPASDPLYGDGSGAPGPTIRRTIRLGELALRGERGGIVVSPAEMLRQRWNPFFPYMERRILEFSGLKAPNP